MNFIIGKKQQFVLEQLNFDLQVTSWYFFPLKKLLIWWVKCQGKNSHPILNLANLIFLNINDILRFDFFKIRFCFFNRGKDFFFSSKECIYFGILSVQFSCSVMSDSLWPHGLQHARPPCPLSTPGAYSNSCPLSRWCQPTISSCSPLLLLPSIFPSIRVFSNESVLHIR